LNSPALNNAVFKFLQRITDLLQADWLFYQVDFLAIMQGILANKEIRVRIIFPSLGRRGVTQEKVNEGVVYE